MAHRHEAEFVKTTCYISRARGAHENSAAHGDICDIETCACGARRETNLNGVHIERGEWIRPDIAGTRGKE